MAKETKDLKSTSKKATKNEISSSKKASAKTKIKTALAKKNTTKKSTSTKSVKKDSTKKTSTTKKASSTTKKSTSTKKIASKKGSKTKKASSTTKRTTKKGATKSKVSHLAKAFQSEYYDLPQMYNKTIVKILAQTPKMLFIYWEISEDDRNLFKKLYGENFFNNTKPILVVYNDTMNYSFEVEIDDFANSWYLHINDANCDYHIELGRKPISHKVQNNETSYIPYYVYITSSNEMASPNNRILFDPRIKTIRFRNVKTGEIKEKDIMQFTFITNFGIFNIKELYTYLFPNESFEFENIILGNTSSGALSSSGMFSSQFK